MHTLHRISHGLERAITVTGKGAMWLAIPLMLVIVFDVVTRKFFAQSMGMISSKLQDLEWHLNGIIIMVLMSYGYLADTHVRIELIRDRLSTQARAWIEVVGILVLMVPFCLLMIYFGYDFAERSFLQQEQSAAMTGLGQRWMIKAIIPAGFALALLATFSLMLKCVLFLIDPAGDAAAARRYLGDMAAKRAAEPEG